MLENALQNIVQTDLAVVEPTTSVVTAVILGVVQGFTEFLPVSSSGHLEIAKFILDDGTVKDPGLMMTVVLHFATALSTIVVFRTEILRLLRGLLQFKWNDEFEFCLKIVLSMIPAAIIGVLFKDKLEQLFHERILLVGMMLVITAILLLLADRARRTEKKVGWFDAVVIGISQAIALMPGISRSGATISTSVLLGIDREESARFSFLMVVPLILGYMAKEVLTGDITTSAGDALPLSIGFVVAFLTGLVACTWMISLVKKARLSVFAYYCFAVAVLAIYWAWHSGA